MRRSFFVLGIMVVGCSPADSVDGGQPDADIMDVGPSDASSMDMRQDTGPLIDANRVDAQPVDGQPVDAQPVDAQPVDAQPVDAQPVDAQPVDGQPVDAQLNDASAPDLGSVDAMPDVELVDAGAADVGAADVGGPDAAAPDEGVEAADALVQPACGNGQVELEEACDDGNLVAGDGCDEMCAVEACGNAVVDEGEDCDDANPDCDRCLSVGFGQCLDPCDATGSVERLARSQIFLGSADAQLRGVGAVLSRVDDLLVANAMFTNRTGGAVTVYDRTPDGGWREGQIVLRGRQGSVVGDAVLVHADGLFVGATGVDQAAPNSGVVYWFERTAEGVFEISQTLISDIVNPAQDRFGSALGRSGEQLAVGAYRSRNGGAVYVYARDEAGMWQGVQRLGSGLGGFGRRLAMLGDRMVVGAPEAIETSDRNGGVIVYARDEVGQWALEQVIFSDRIRAEERFGSSIALSADEIFVGTPGWLGDPDDHGGYVSVLRKADGVWAPVQILQAPEPVEYGRFGHSLAVAGDTLYVGAPRDGVGKVYRFVRSVDGWQFAERITPGADAVHDYFGAALVTDDDGLIVGDPNADDLGLNTGSLSVWRPDNPCRSDGSCLCVQGADGAQCTQRPVCGDGAQQTAEACDDGNLVDGDGCSATCVVEP